MSTAPKNESKGLMQTSCKMAFEGIFIAMGIGVNLVLAHAENSMTCYPIELKVENLSNHTVQISELLWLNSKGTDWLGTAADSGEIKSGDQWQTTFCMTGLEGETTFISIKYSIKLRRTSKKWSHDHLGKQVHVQLDRTPVFAQLDIARRNLRSR